MPASWDGQNANIKKLLQLDKERILKQCQGLLFPYKYTDLFYTPLDYTKQETTTMADVKTENVTGKKVTVGRFQGTKLNNNTQVTITGTYDLDYKTHNLLLSNKQELKDLYKLLGELLLEEVK